MANPSLILLVLEDEQGKLRFLVNPELSSLVGSDLVYIEPLLEDFPARAEHCPGDLFKQLSSLGVGPLVAHATGGNLANHPSMGKLFAKFIPL